MEKGELLPDSFINMTLVCFAAPRIVWLAAFFVTTSNHRCQQINQDWNLGYHFKANTSCCFILFPETRKQIQTSIGFQELLPVVITFLKAEDGAISAPLSVRRRNMGHEEAFILKPGHKVKTQGQIHSTGERGGLHNDIYCVTILKINKQDFLMSGLKLNGVNNNINAGSDPFKCPSNGSKLELMYFSARGEYSVS